MQTHTSNAAAKLKDEDILGQTSSMKLAPMLHVGLMETAHIMRIVDPSLLLLG
jgi:hypothetical protein